MMADTTETRADPNFISEAGDVITETMVITTQAGKVFDVSNFVLEVSLIEDIFSNVLTGEALFLDSADLINKIPLQGTEYLTISYRTPSFIEKIEKSFKITAVRNRGFSNTDREQAYILSFISIEGAVDNITNLTQKYSGTTDEIVKKIWRGLFRLPRLVSRPDSKTDLYTSNQRQGSAVTFVAANWSAFQTINWVASRSFQSGTELCGYQLYESNKAFYFRNLEELVETQDKANDVFARYLYVPSASSIQNIPKSNVIYTKPEILKQFSIVRNIKPFDQFDILDWQDSAFVAGKLITHDIALKTYQEYFFDYYAPYSKEVSSNKDRAGAQTYPVGIIRNSEVKQTLRTKHHKAHNDLKDPLYEKWVLQRNSLLHELSGVNVEIEVPGRTDIEVGKLVDFVYPKAIDKMEGSSQTIALDEFMTARYLITAIKHVFALNKHTMYVELVRFI
jgi:hypothetical protein